METRTCTKCSYIKPLSEFHFRKERNSYRSDCKQCCNERSRKWRAENPDKCKEFHHKWYTEHKEEDRDRVHKRRVEHPGQYKEYQRKWVAEHPDKVREYYHKYKQTPQGKMSNRNHSHNRRAKIKGKKITLAEWTIIKEQQGFRCYWCKVKFKDEELTMDHVIPLSKGGLNEANNIVASCMPCNRHKGTKLLSLI